MAVCDLWTALRGAVVMGAQLGPAVGTQLDFGSSSVASPRQREPGSSIPREQNAPRFKRAGGRRAGGRRALAQEREFLSRQLGYQPHEMLASLSPGHMAFRWGLRIILRSMCCYYHPCFSTEEQFREVKPSAQGHTALALNGQSTDVNSDLSTSYSLLCGWDSCFAPEPVSPCKMPTAGLSWWRSG